ncbi:prepilin-type N-terminal cleavage/methylation domain-containing protein [Paenibacillus tritici]|nr:prepilin-type N-terminal cleavage/methylation domain-containing protein [Paenibacillus tritici]
MAQAIKRRLSKEESQKGFTLIELLAVIVILGIIAVIAIPMISGILNKSRNDADVATANQIYNAARLYITSELNGDFSNDSTGTTKTITVKVLQDTGYLEASLYLPSTKAAIENTSKVVFASGVLQSVNLNSKAYSAAAVLRAAPTPTPVAAGS